MDDTEEQALAEIKGIEEQLRQMEADPKTHSLDLSNDPAADPKTWENLMTLEKAYRLHGRAGLKNAYDQLFPEE